MEEEEQRANKVEKKKTMEVLSLHSLPAAARNIPSISPRRRRRAGTKKPSSFLGQALNFPSKTKIRNLDATHSKHLNSRPRASGTTQVTSSGRRMDETDKQEANSKDKDLAFVAGATGRVGSRVVRELLKIGFRVRAGVRNAQRAQTLVQSVKQIKEYGKREPGNSTPAVEKLEIVECDLENKSNIGAAIGNASIVICCIGASEKEVFDVTGPYRIDYKASVNLIETATVAKVDHFILLTSLGTNKIGFPASLLNLFWGVLIWKRKAEEALIASGLPYTIVRPGGMERPTDSYKETHNIVLANEDTYFGGQVSNLQVAELLAFMAKNRKLSFCKVVEVIAETSAPLTPIEELLAKIPSQREVPAELELDPVPLSIESEPTGSAAEKVLGQMESPKTTPLSPYTAYDDLKPPTSPTPTPCSPTVTSKDKSSVSVQPKSEPEPSFDDLKPPTSTPTLRSVSVDVNGPLYTTPLVPNTGDVASGTTAVEVNEKELPQSPPRNSSSLSPYNAYDDFKPPTSPSPSTPGSYISTSAPSNLEEPEEGGQAMQKISSPLSPFTMYEDLKPPSSPIPSVPKY